MNRTDVAKELAVKDGHEWGNLSPKMVNAYLHNADLAIADRENPTVVEGEAAPDPYTCMVCKDVGVIKGKPCYECNPVGLAKETATPPDEGKAKADEPEGVITKGYKDELGKWHVGDAVPWDGQPIDMYHSPEGEVPSDNSSSGAGQDNQPTGGGDTGKPEQPAKPKAKRKTRKGTR